MIIGIGHDLTAIARFIAIMEGKTCDRFLQRILTDSERQQLAQYADKGRRAEFVAGRFAAKEAVSKALGCGIGAALGFQDMQIEKLPSGKPQCSVSEAAMQRLELAGRAITIHLSITHERDHASAFAVVEQC